MSKGRLGVIGCGQLSQMLGEAANRLGYSVAYLCVDETPVVEGLGSIYFPDQLDAFLADAMRLPLSVRACPMQC